MMLVCAPLAQNSGNDIHRAIEITIRTRSCDGQVKHQCITCQAINKGLRLRETLCDNADKLFGVHG